MKLQWLPKPNSKGGWDLSEYNGFDKNWDIISTVREDKDDWSYCWKCEYDDKRYSNKDDAIVAAELKISEPFKEIMIKLDWRKTPEDRTMEGVSDSGQVLVTIKFIDGGWQIKIGRSYYLIVDGQTIRFANKELALSFCEELVNEDIWKWN